MELMLNGWRIFFEGGDELRLADAISQAQAGEAEDLGERALDQKVGLFAASDEREQINRLIQKFDVGLVHHQEDAFSGISLIKCEDIGGRGEGAGRDCLDWRRRGPAFAG